MKYKFLFLLLLVIAGHARAQHQLPKWPRGYHKYPAIYKYLFQWREEYPHLTKMKIIGTTRKKNPLVAMRIGTNNKAPEVLYFGLTHGCEPLSAEVVIRYMAFLLDRYKKDPFITKLLDTRQLWFIPVLNPDGLDRYYEGNFFWKANVSSNDGASFSRQGVDLNRNFGFEWAHDDVGSRGTPGHFGFGGYRGEAPFSELESKALRNFVLKHNFILSFSFHTFGEQYLYPFNYGAAPADKQWYEAYTGHLASKNGYSTGNAESGEIHLSNGDIDDWLYGDRKIRAVTVELAKLFIGPYGGPEEHFQVFSKTLYGNLFMAAIADDLSLVEDPERLGKLEDEITQAVSTSLPSGP